MGLQLGEGAVGGELDPAVADVERFGGDVAFPEGAEAFVARDGGEGAEDAAVGGGFEGGRGGLLGDEGGGGGGGYGRGGEGGCGGEGGMRL